RTRRPRPPGRGRRSRSAPPRPGGTAAVPARWWPPRRRVRPGARRQPRSAAGPAAAGARSRPTLPEVAAERHHREGVPVEVVADGEVAREADAGEPGLVPGALGRLLPDEPVDAPGHRRRPTLARGQQGEQRPRRL